MEININKIVDIYSQKLANSEKENVLLQAQALVYEELVKEKNKKIEELENKLKDEYKVIENKK